MPIEKTFEDTYPKYPFAKLVGLAVKVSRAVAKLNRERKKPERLPDVFLVKIVAKYPG